FLPFTSPQMRDGLQEFLSFRDPRLASIFLATSDAAGVATFAKLPMAPTTPVLDRRDELATRYAVAAEAENHEYGSAGEGGVDAARGGPAADTLRVSGRGGRRARRRADPRRGGRRVGLPVALPRDDRREGRLPGRSPADVGEELPAEGRRRRPQGLRAGF